MAQRPWRWIALLIAAPVHALGSVADTRIEAVARIEAHIVLDQRWFRIVQVTDIVLRWKFRAARVQQCPHTAFDLGRVVTFAHDVVLVEDVAEEVAII